MQITPVVIVDIDQAKNYLNIELKSSIIIALTPDAFFFLKNNEMDPANIYAQTMAGIMVALKGSVMFVKSDLNLIRLSPAHSNLASYYTKNNSNSNWNLELKLPYNHPKNSIIILKYLF